MSKTSRAFLLLENQLEELQHPVGFQDFLDRLAHKDWVVFSKEPLSRPETVLEYLGRYTHRVAISNERLLGMEGEDVLFRFKDYQRGGRWRTERIHAHEFIRRFLLHILPFRFVRIRYFGLFGNRHRQQNLELCRQLLGLAPPESNPRAESFEARCERLTGVDPKLCPACKTGQLVLRATIPRPFYSALRTQPETLRRLPTHPPTCPRAPPCSSSVP